MLFYWSLTFCSVVLVQRDWGVEGGGLSYQRHTQEAKSVIVAASFTHFC